MRSTHWTLAVDGARLRWVAGGFHVRRNAVSDAPIISVSPTPFASEVPEDLWPEFKVRVTAAYQAPSRAIARGLTEGLVKDYEAELPSAVACFIDDWRQSRTCGYRPPTAGRSERRIS